MVREISDEVAIEDKHEVELGNYVKQIKIKEDMQVEIVWEQDFQNWTGIETVLSTSFDRTIWMGQFDRNSSFI